MPIPTWVGTEDLSALTLTKAWKVYVKYEEVISQLSVIEHDL